jgi:hypothetical protein
MKSLLFGAVDERARLFSISSEVISWSPIIAGINQKQKLEIRTFEREVFSTFPVMRHI